MSGIFVDTGAWFARFVPTDPDHPAAKVWLDHNTSPLITTAFAFDRHFREFGIVTVVPPLD